MNDKIATSFPTNMHALSAVYRPLQAEYMSSLKKLLGQVQNPQMRSILFVFTSAHSSFL